MPNDDLVYSRDEVVSTLTSFYKFLVRLHLPSSAVKNPPSGGWPNITSDSLAGLKKNDAVVDLLRHIPYVHRDGPDVPYQIYESTSAVDYEGPHFQKQASSKSAPIHAEPLAEETVLPPHVATLAVPAKGKDGYFIFLDTERGTVTMCDFQSGPDPTELSQDVKDGSEESWRGFETYAVKDFFEMLKEQYRSLEVMPTSPTNVEMLSKCRMMDMDKVKEIYRAHGWPSEDFKKEECLKKVEKTWKDM